MKRTIFWALVAVNAVLLTTLLAPYISSNRAMAQRAGAAGGNRRPELLMIPGDVPGGNSAAVYLIDTANRRLGAIMLNNKGNGLDSFAPQPLDRVFDDRAAEPAGKPGAKPGVRAK